MSETLRLTVGEKLLIDRLRRGESQVQAAKRLGLGASRKNYQLFESDTVKYPAPAPKLSSLKSGEKCRLMRRRCGKTQAEIADDLGISRYWLNQMEVGNADPTALLCYWES